jgi:hypothetical protein
MRMVAFCVALAALLLAGCGGGDVSEVQPAGVGVTDGPAGD